MIARGGCGAAIDREGFRELLRLRPRTGLREASWALVEAIGQEVAAMIEEARS